MGDTALTARVPVLHQAVLHQAGLLPFRALLIVARTGTVAAAPPAQCLLLPGMAGDDQADRRAALSAPTMTLVTTRPPEHLRPPRHAGVRRRHGRRFIARAAAGVLTERYPPGGVLTGHQPAQRCARPSCSACCGTATADGRRRPLPGT